MPKDLFKKRIRIIFSLFVLIALIMVIRLYFLQIVNGENYSDKADRQYISASTDTFDRGNIFFQSKDGSLVSAASLKSGYILALNVKNMSGNAEDYYKKISSIIPLDAASFYAKASKKDDPYEEIATHIKE
ncbi:MAG: hypothetical protein WCX27_01105, partial [Candidatus Paceibacterota bacterium]